MAETMDVTCRCQIYERFRFPGGEEMTWHSLCSSFSCQKIR